MRPIMTLIIQLVLFWAEKVWYEALNLIDQSPMSIALMLKVY